MGALKLCLVIGTFVLMLVINHEGGNIDFQGGASY